MSECRSFGSTFHPSSQSRKISIGVMVDSFAKRNPGGTQEDRDKQANHERIKPCVGISSQEKNKGHAVKTSQGKQTEYPEQVKSPWITPRSLHKKALAPETTTVPEETSNPGQKKPNADEDVPETSRVPLFPNRNFDVCNDGSQQNKLNSLAYKRKDQKDGNSQRVEEFDFANARKDKVEFDFANARKDKVEFEQKTGKTQNIQTETLKMKLQELLGVSPPKSRQSSLQSHDVSANNFKKQERKAGHVGDTALKPRQNSATIEVVTDNPDKTVKMPVTRSLIRKRVPAKVKLANTKTGLSSEQKRGDSIFSFSEGRSANLDGTVNIDSLLRRKKKTSKIDPHQNCFPEEDNTVEIKQTIYRSESPLPAEKTSILSKKIERLPDSSSEKGRENFEKVQENDYYHSPMTNKTNQQDSFDNPTSREKGDKQEENGNASLRNFLHTEDDFQSPTFGFRTSNLNTSSSPTPKTVAIGQGTCSPVASERGYTLRNFESFRTFQTAGPVSNKSTPETSSPEDTEKHTASSLRDPMPAKRKIDAVNEHSESSESEEQSSENIEEGSPIIKRYDCHREDLISPETVISEKPNFVHSPIKRFQNEDVRLSELSPTSPSPKGTGIEDTYWFQEPMEQDQEDELTRAITLFALALQTFKRKMDSATRKKSSEILVSISEEMKSMFLNAESHIESDVGKLTSLCKTKRKRLETRLQEQQEQLKLILEKFKEDIHHHLSDCSSILEGMEAHQNELKGTMKKQKVSHQKLLMHVEEAARTQLDNAERRIKAVHESAREKMLQLKHVVAECLTGIY